MAAQIVARLVSSREGGHEGAPLASLTTDLGDLETHKLRLHGPLHSDMERSGMALRAAEVALVTGRKQQSELPEGPKEDAEAAILQRQEAADATLLEALNEARAGTLEDHEESRRASEDRA